MTRWESSMPSDPSLNLATQTLTWLDALIAPLRQARKRMESLAERADVLRQIPQRAA